MAANFKLLYVCRANLFRSYAAEILTREKTRGAGIYVDSAGLEPLSMRPSSFFYTALKNLGHSPERHAPKQVNAELLTKQDIILCMTRRQVSEVLDIATEMEHKVLTLPEFAGFPGQEILDPADYFLDRGFDPFGKSGYIVNKQGLVLPEPSNQQTVEVYEAFVRDIERCTDLAVQRILREGAVP